MWNATTRQYPFRFGGGVYLQSTPGGISPGMLADVRNYEIGPSGGYRPILGYEPVDGQTIPSEAVFNVLYLGNIADTISAGDVINDGGSKSAIALADIVVTSGTDGYVIVMITAGSWAAADEVYVSGKVADVTAVSSDDVNPVGVDRLTTKRLAITAQMARIGAIPGSGPVRGVVEFDDTLYGWRDNELGVACDIYKSTAAGWELVDIGSIITFEAGHGFFEVGQTITGTTSGATGIVGASVIEGGDTGHDDLQTNGTFDTDSGWTKGSGWTISGGTANHTTGTATLEQNIVVSPGDVLHVKYTVSGVSTGSVTASAGGTAGTARSTNGTFTEDIIAGATTVLAFTPSTSFNGKIDNVEVQLHGDAFGRVAVIDITGTFQAGEDLVTASFDGTSASAAIATTIAPGGAYRLKEYNFSGQEATTAIYGCDGVNKAFEFNGHAVLPITTGLPDDTPTDIAVHKSHLFLAKGSSIVHSGIGTPHDWTALAGAAEIAIGSDEREMLTVAGALVIWSADKTKILYGSSADDWSLVDFSDTTGAERGTVQLFGNTPIFMHRDRVATMTTTSSFGDFKSSSVSQNVDPLLDKFETNISGSCVVSELNQYRLFLDSKLVVVGSMAKSGMEWMLHEYAHAVSCCSPHGRNMYFGSTDGFVYKMDSGSTFAGVPIKYYLRVLYSNLGSPQLRKLLRGIKLELDEFGGHYLDLKVYVDAGKHRKYAPKIAPTTVTSQAGDGIWGGSLWNVFVWNSTAPSYPQARMRAIGTEFSFSLYSTTELADYQRYTLAWATIVYSNRGVQR